MKAKYTVLMAALAASLFGVPALAASTATSTSGSSANGTGIGIGGGNAQSNSQSGAVSGSTAVGSLGQGGNATAGSSSNGGYSGSSVNFTYNDPPAVDPATQTERLVTVGNAIAPSIYNNNLCSLGASAAAGAMGWGFALGFDRIDHGCDVRANASLLGHFAEIYSIAAAHAPDPGVRQLAETQAAIYAQWANNYICMSNPDLAAAAPPDAHFCHTVATQGGVQVVPAPVAIAAPPRPIVQAAAVVDPPPPKPTYTGPHIYGQHEGGVPTSYHTGPISGYAGPEYTDD